MEVKKITLKKEVIAKMSVNEMGNLWGGQNDYPPYYDEKYICQKDGTNVYVPPVDLPPTVIPPPPNTCGTAWTCNG